MDGPALIPGGIEAFELAACRHPAIQRWLRAEAAKGADARARAADLLARGIPAVVCWEHARVVTELVGVRGQIANPRHGAGRLLEVRPIGPGDPWDPYRIVYVYLDSLPSQQRINRRLELKDRLGRGFTGLVKRARRLTKAAFRASLTRPEWTRIRERLDCDAGRFWQLCAGKEDVPAFSVVGPEDDAEELARSLGLL